MRKFRRVLIVAISAISIWLFSNLLGDIRGLSAQVNELQAEVNRVKAQQSAGIKHDVVQDRLIGELAFEVHRPAPIKAEDKTPYPKVEPKPTEVKQTGYPALETPPIPMIIGAMELIKNVIFR